MSERISTNEWGFYTKTFHDSVLVEDSAKADELLNQSGVFSISDAGSIIVFNPKNPPEKEQPTGFLKGIFSQEGRNIGKLSERAAMTARHSFFNMRLAEQLLSKTTLIESHSSSERAAIEALVKKSMTNTFKSGRAFTPDEFKNAIENANRAYHSDLKQAQRQIQEDPEACNILFKGEALDVLSFCEKTGGDDMPSFEELSSALLFHAMHNPSDLAALGIKAEDAKVLEGVLYRGLDAADAHKMFVSLADKLAGSFLHRIGEMVNEALAQKRDPLAVKDLAAELFKAAVNDPEGRIFPKEALFGSEGFLVKLNRLTVSSQETQLEPEEAAAQEQRMSRLNEIKGAFPDLDDLKAAQLDAYLKKQDVSLNDFKEEVLNLKDLHSGIKKLSYDAPQKLAEFAVKLREKLPNAMSEELALAGEHFAFYLKLSDRNFAESQAVMLDLASALEKESSRLSAKAGQSEGASEDEIKMLLDLHAFVRGADKSISRVNGADASILFPEISLKSLAENTRLFLGTYAINSSSALYQEELEKNKVPAKAREPLTRLLRHELHARLLKEPKAFDLNRNLEELAAALAAKKALMSLLAGTALDEDLAGQRRQALVGEEGAAAKALAEVKDEPEFTAKLDEALKDLTEKGRILTIGAESTEKNAERTRELLESKIPASSRQAAAYLISGALDDALLRFAGLGDDNDLSAMGVKEQGEISYALSTEDQNLVIEAQIDNKALLDEDVLGQQSQNVRLVVPINNEDGLPDVEKISGELLNPRSNQ